MKVSQRKKRIAFAGGGSGGHILPILSLMEYIDTHCQFPVDSVYWFGEKKGMEYGFFQKQKNNFLSFSPVFFSILSGKYRRETIWISRWRNFRDMFLFPLGILQSLFLIVRYRIDVVFCKGGYVSLPVILAARILRRKIVVHDSDTQPGLTTRLASKFSSANFSGFPDTLPDSICVGQILSTHLLDDVPSSKSPIGSSRNFSLNINNPSKPISILIAGGSLGSRKLYQGVLSAIKNLGGDQKNYTFIFINAKQFLDDFSIKESENIIFTDLIKNQSQMGRYYSDADMAIVRGGTTTLAECKLFDLPLVIVPLPITHDQKSNAEFYQAEYGDAILSQNDKHFVQDLEKFIKSANPKSKTYEKKCLIEKIQSTKQKITQKLFS